MQILIVGAGVAGLTLAGQLFAAGHQVVLVERAQHLRVGGYMIDFFGPGYDVAERMGLLPELEAVHYPVARLSFLENDGSEKWSLDYRKIRDWWFGGRHFNFMRGDLVEVLHRRVDGRVPVRFQDSVEALEQTNEHVEVTFSSGLRERYDLVLGADGVSSRVRQLAFPPSTWERLPLGYHTAAYVLERASDELCSLSPDAFCSLSVVQKQVSVYPVRGRRLATFFLHATPLGVVRPGDGEAAICADLERVYGDLGWLAPAVLQACPGEGLYHDEVVQIVMESWSRGRIGLVGDACGCVSLVAGQGASLAMLGASVLAEEIRRAPNDPFAALRRYEARVRPVVASKQKVGRRMASWFAPRSRTRLALRDAFMRVTSQRLFAGVARRSLIGS